MVGPLLNTAGIVSGSLFGVLLARHIPETMKRRLPMVFGIIALSIGITMVMKVQNLPPVVIAVIFGTIIGELLHLEEGVLSISGKLQQLTGKIASHSTHEHSQEEHLEKFIAVAVLFSVSTLGIFGALEEGISGDFSLLLIKSILDFFTAIIFAAGIGIITVTAALPQLIIQSALFFAATLLIPITDDIILADFSAAGGMILLATGFKISGIKPFPVVAMLPSLVLIMPFSHLWVRFFG